MRNFHNYEPHDKWDTPLKTETDPQRITLEVVFFLGIGNCVYRWQSSSATEHDTNFAASIPMFDDYGAMIHFLIESREIPILDILFWLVVWNIFPYIGNNHPN